MNISKKMNLCLMAALLIAFFGNANEEKIKKFNKMQGYCIEKSRKPLLIDKKIDKLALSPDGKSMAFYQHSESDHTIKVWDTQTGVFKYNLVGHERYITSLEFSSDGKWIVSAAQGNKNNLIIWNASDGTVKHNLVGHPGTVNSAKFSPDGALIVSCGYGDENNLIVWNVSNGAQKHNLLGHNSPLDYFFSVNFAEFSPDGALIVSSSSGGQGNLIIWNASSGSLKHSLVGRPEEVLSVAFSPDGKKIVSSYSIGYENNLVTWNVLNGKLEYNLVGPGGSFALSKYCSISSNGKWIIAISESDCIGVWNALKGEFKYMLFGYPAVFSPDGTQIITSSDEDEYNIIIHNAAGGEEKYELVGHLGSPYLIMFSSNGNAMISASTGKAGSGSFVFLWDARPLKWNVNDFSDDQVNFLYRLYRQRKENDTHPYLIQNDSGAPIYNSFSVDKKEIIKQAFNILDSNKSWFSFNGLKNSAFGKKVYELYKFLSFK